MASVSQLNVRLNSDVKAAGDSVLDLYGVSATEIIRSLWEKLACGEEGLRQVVEMLAAPPAAGATKRQVDVAGYSSIGEYVMQRQRAFEMEVGLDPSTYVQLSDEELDDLVYQDYLEEYAKKVMRD